VRDHPGRNLLFRGLVVLAQPLSVQVEDVEGGRILDISRRDIDEAVGKRSAIRVKQCEVREFIDEVGLAVDDDQGGRFVCLEIVQDGPAAVSN